MRQIPSTMFSYNATSRVMSADASDLHAYIGNLVANRVSVCSARTGSTEIFTLRDTIRDIEGDVEYWVYCNDQINVRIRIYND